MHRLFDELEFRVLRERLFATLQSAEPEAEGGIEVQGGALAPGAVRAWLDAHARDGRRVGLAFHGITGGAAGRRPGRHRAGRGRADRRGPGGGRHRRGAAGRLPRR